MEQHPAENWETRRTEEVGCKIYGGTPAVTQDYGIGEGESF